MPELGLGLGIDKQGLKQNPIIPSSLQANSLALYTTRPSGLSDFSVDMTNGVTNGDLANGLTGWIHFSDWSTESIVNGWLRSTKGTSRPYFGRDEDFNYSIGSVVLVTFKVKGSKSGAMQVSLHPASFGSGGISTPQNFSVTTLEQTFVRVFTPVTGEARGISIDGSAFTVDGDFLEIKDLMAINLSLPFGTLNEPASTEFADMLTYKGKTFWNGTEKVVINPNDKYYLIDRSVNGRHKHQINVAYDSTGGLQVGPPAFLLYDGINDYDIFNSTTDIVAVQGAFSHFGMYQAKDAFASPHRLIQLSDQATTLCGDLVVSATAVTFTVQDSTSGTSVATISVANLVNKWVGISCVYDPVTKRAGISRNGSAITWGSALTNGSRKINRMVTACNYLLNAFNNVRKSEECLLNKVMTDADAKSIFNNVATRYGLTKA